MDLGMSPGDMCASPASVSAEPRGPVAESRRNSSPPSRADGETSNYRRRERACNQDESSQVVLAYTN